MADFIPTWANAIAQFEGFSVPGSRPARNNNPGDLMYAGQPGATGKDSGGFAVFPDAPTGWQALYNQLAAYVTNFPGYSILQIMAHYLGQGSTPTIDSQGNAFTYGAAVASALGVDSSTTLAELAAGSAGVAAGATPDAGAAGDISAPITGAPTSDDLLLLIGGGLLIFFLLSRVTG